jgi:hypothetical protein
MRAIVVSVLILCACESSVPVTPPVMQPSIAAPDPVPGGPEQISTTGSLPDVATIATGDAIAIWREAPARAEHRLVARRRHAGRWSRAETIAATTSGEMFWPRIAMASDGRAIAVWQQLDLGADREPIDHGVWAALFDPASGWTRATRIGEHGDGWIVGGSTVRLAVGADGSAIAVWSWRRAGRHDLYASTYRAGVWAAAVAIESEDSGDAMAPQVAVDRSGNVMVVWEQSSGFPASSSPTHIWATRFGAGRWIAAAPIEHHDGGSSLAPQLAVADDGSAVAIWERRYGRNTIEGATFHPARGWSQPEVIQTDAGEGTTPRLVGDTGIWVSRTIIGDELWSRPHTATGWGTAHRLASTWPYELLVAKAASRAVVVQRDHAGCPSLFEVATDGTWGHATAFASCSQAFSDAVAASSDVLVAWSHGDGVWVLAL